MQFGQALPRQQRDLDGANELCAANVSARGIERLAPAPQLLRRRAVEQLLDAQSPVGIHRRLRPQWLEERADIETGAANHDRNSAARQRLADRPARERGPVGRGIPLGWLDDVDASMRNFLAFVTGRLGRADVEAAVDLPRVGADDDNPATQRQPHGHRRFARRRGATDYGNALDGRGDVNVFRIGARAHPTKAARWWTDRGRRAPAVYSRGARRT